MKCSIRLYFIWVFAVCKRTRLGVSPEYEGLMHASANGEDQDEMLHFAAFHQILHYMLSQKQSSEVEIYNIILKS